MPCVSRGVGVLRGRWRRLGRTKLKTGCSLSCGGGSAVRSGSGSPRSTHHTYPYTMTLYVIRVTRVCRPGGRGVRSRQKFVPRETRTSNILMWRGYRCVIARPRARRFAEYLTTPPRARPGLLVSTRIPPSRPGVPRGMTVYRVNGVRGEIDLPVVVVVVGCGCGCGGNINIRVWYNNIIQSVYNIYASLNSRRDIIHTSTTYTINSTVQGFRISGDFRENINLVV